MPIVTENLWPSDLNLDVIQPVTILKIQGDKLNEHTHGMLLGEVTTVTGEKDFVVHRLDILAPRLNNYRHRILTAIHREQYYPVQIEAECFRPKTRTRKTSFASIMNPYDREWTEPLTWPPVDDWRAIANSQDELLKKIGEVLKSPEARSTIDSLIARSNEVDLETREPGEQHKQ